MPPGHSIRIATHDEFSSLFPARPDSQVFRYILKPRFHSEENFLKAMGEAESVHARQICVAADRIVGWACCFRFHERQGYAGVAQWVMDLLVPDPDDTLKMALFHQCESLCRERGMHTIISFVHSEMTASIAWHRSTAFEHCGAISLGDDASLSVFCRKIAQ